MPARSYLFVPGDRPERFAKALASGAHAVILDLEDAVQPARKAEARHRVVQWLASASQAVLVRINPAETPWHDDDCAVLVSPQVRGVMIPKAQARDDVIRVGSHLRPEQEILPLIETAAGYACLSEIAACPQVGRLAFGTFDFMADTGIQEDGQALDAIRTQMVLTSRLAQLAAPIDGVCLAVDDAERIRAETLRSRRWGMGGKLCIHPAQVDAVNVGFAPTDAERAWAARVMQALQSGTLGAVAVDGKLVDRPIALRAQTILSEAA